MKIKSENKLVTHTFKPVYDENSKILILGTIPSPKSRENGFYYGHPQNRFWKVIAKVLNEELPKTNEEKENLMLKNKIALFDVLSSCNITNADDSSIKSEIPNDFSEIFEKANIKAIFTTGKKATKLYEKYFVKTKEDLKPIYLPSTSGANCSIKIEKLIEEFEVICKYIK